MTDATDSRSVEDDPGLDPDPGADADADSGSSAVDPTGAEVHDGTGDDSGGTSLVVRSFLTVVRADSLVLRTYAVVGTLVAAFAAVLVVLAFPGWVANTVGGTATDTFSRGFLLVGGLAVVVPLLAPMLYAARRRREGSEQRRHELLFGLAGYAVVGSLYAALLVSAPADARGTPPDFLAPVVGTLYGLPALTAPAFPATAATLVVVLDRVLPRTPGPNA